MTSEEYSQKLKDQAMLDEAARVAREKAKKHNQGREPCSDDVLAFLFAELGIK